MANDDGVGYGKAHRCVGRLRTGVPLSDLARDAGHSGSYLRTRLPLAFLSPRIQAAILEGAQPPDLTLERIVRARASRLVGAGAPLRLQGMNSRIPVLRDPIPCSLVKIPCSAEKIPC